MSLDKVRQEIDAIDKELVALLQRRLNCSVQVAEVKAAEGIPVLDPAREEKIIGKVKTAGGAYGEYVAGVYRSIMDVSKELQHDRMGGISPLASEIMAAARFVPPAKDGRVACQGAPGAFSQAAADRLFPGAAPKFFDSFREVFAAVERGEADYGVLPVENSNAGSVAEVYDLLLEYRHYIVGGVELTVSQNLLALPGAAPEDVREVLSHPQGIAQCDRYIKAHGYAAREASNTAVAARTVAESKDRTKAAIGSLAAAETYGLSVLARDIQTVGHNATRFIAVSKTLIVSPQSNKISLVFSIPHVTGSLCRILTRFSTHGLNLTKIESRVVPGGEFTYLFYLDFTGSVGDLSTVRLICDLAEELPDFAFLGNYRELPEV
ncbi:MAG: chorismate mutase [Candidatus Howiella sp.]|jgi:chorismate mutase/prephenate dehydratase